MKKYLMAFSFAAMLATGLFINSESANAQQAFDPEPTTKRWLTDVQTKTRDCVSTTYYPNC